MSVFKRELQIYVVKANKKVVLFPEIGRVKILLSLTRPHSRMCIRVCIFNFKKTKQNNTKQKGKKSKIN